MTYNLFVSHAWAHGGHYDELLEMLRASPRFDFRDFSVPQDDPVHGANDSAALTKAFRSRMQPCHAVLVMAGVYASHSPWMEVEMHLARNGFKTRKPMIGIMAPGNVRKSEWVSDEASRIVPWDRRKIVEAIRTEVATARRQKRS